MEKCELLRHIAQVGSVAYQERYVLHADANEYLLLDDLIDIVLTEVDSKIGHPVLSRNLTESDRAALVIFCNRVSELFSQVPWNSESHSTDELFHCVALQQIREAAQNCLSSLGVQFTYEELVG